MSRSFVRFASFAVAILAGCGTIIEPESAAGDGNLRIVVDAGSITRIPDTQVVEVRATVTNVSNRDVFANVGDGFNGALEQEWIFAALGTDAVIEKFLGADAWSSASAGVLIEGSRFVVLKPGKSYTLIGSVNQGPAIYRIRFSYSDVNNDASTALPFRDYSEPFTVR